MAKPMDVLARLQILANRDPQSRGNGEYHRREARAAEKAIKRVTELLEADEEYAAADAALEGQTHRAMDDNDTEYDAMCDRLALAKARQAAAIRSMRGDS